jgi:hypothetical protein
MPQSKPASPPDANDDEPAPDVDSAGVYFLSIEEFEGRPRRAAPAKPEPKGREEREEPEGRQERDEPE